MPAPRQQHAPHAQHPAHLAPLRCLSARSLSRSAHLWVHAGVLLLPLAVLPVTVPSLLGQDGPPALRLLSILALSIGLPFAVLSTTGPLLQRWYSWTQVARSADPYFLFAASSLGSFGGLLAYPLVIEPALTVGQQRVMWSGGFVAFVALVASCGVVVGRSPRTAPPERLSVQETPARAITPPTRRTLLTWLGLAFLPATLLLSVTSHMSTDVAAVPLLWVVPLALYLATFVAAFARGSRETSPLLVRAAVVSVALALMVSNVGFPMPITVAITLDLLALTLVAYVSHARLAALRAPVEHLTRFYLVVAAGGALGGLLNGLVAPMIFDRVWEYPGALLASLLLGVGILGAARSPLARRYGRPAALVLHGLAVAAAAILVVGVAPYMADSWWILVLAGVAICAAWAAAMSPLSLGIGLIVFVAVLTGVRQVGSLETVRTFYGSYRISQSDGIRQLQHGTTAHGSQVLARPGEPTTYYARSGPLGDVMGARDHTNTAVIGLGTGTIAAYGRAGDAMTSTRSTPRSCRSRRMRGCSPTCATRRRPSRRWSATVGSGSRRHPIAHTPSSCSTRSAQMPCRCTYSPRRPSTSTHESWHRTGRSSSTSATATSTSSQSLPPRRTT